MPDTRYDLTEVEQKLLETLVLEVFKDPDFVYTPQASAGFPNSEPGCSYFPDAVNPKGCIFGHVMRLIGDPIGMDGPSIYHLLLDRGYGQKVVDFATTVQGQQDNGFSWINALMVATIPRSPYDPIRLFIEDVMLVHDLKIPERV